MSDAFGEWQVDPKTGTAHYVLGGKCLCGAAVKKFDGPPERKPVPAAGGFGGYVTPLCLDCVDQNTARWRKKGGGRTDTVPSKPQREFWWRQPKLKKR